MTRLNPSQVKEQINELVFEQAANRRTITRAVERLSREMNVAELGRYAEEMIALRRQGRLDEARGSRRSTVLPILGTIDATEGAQPRALLRPDVRVIPISAELIRQLELDPTALRFLTPGRFEEFVADRLDRMGFVVSFTGRVNEADGGIDLIAVPKKACFGAPLIAVQVKHRSGNRAVGRPDLDRLLAWKNNPFHLGLLVTNGRITHDAFWLAAQPGNKEWARLREFNDVKRWIQNNFDRELGPEGLPEKIEIRPGLWVPVGKS